MAFRWRDSRASKKYFFDRQHPFCYSVLSADQHPHAGASALIICRYRLPSQRNHHLTWPRVRGPCVL
jgi:hypothetical protein